MILVEEIIEDREELDLTEEVMNAIDHLSDRVQNCSNNEAVGAVMSHLEANLSEKDYNSITEKEVRNIMDECWT